MIVLTPWEHKYTITGHKSFVKTRSVLQNTNGRQVNSKTLPSHRIQKYLQCSLAIGTVRYASLRFREHIQSPGCRRSLIILAPSLLKCSFRIKAFNGFRLTTGWKDPSFFSTTKRRLISWSWHGGTTTTACFRRRFSAIIYCSADSPLC